MTRILLFWFCTKDKRETSRKNKKRGKQAGKTKKEGSKQTEELFFLKLAA